MKITLRNPKESPVSLLRSAGYAFARNEGDEMSFVRPLARAGFPRFHIYTKDENGALVFNIHLDHKRETYGRTTAHHGEYGEDGALAEEAERLKKLFGI